MVKKKINNIFDLVFNEERSQDSIEKKKAVYEVISEEISLSLNVKHDDVTESSIEGKFYGRVNIEVFNN